MKLYITKQDIKELWTGEEMLNWLHPKHGPAPAYVCEASFGKYVYRVALWVSPGSCVISALEQINNDEERPGRGLVLWTAKWLFQESSGAFVHAKTFEEVTAPMNAYGDDEAIYHDIVAAAVADAQETPLGDVMRATRYRMRK